MNKLWLIVIIIATLISCTKESEPVELENGVYKGTFKRYNQPGSETAQVTLELNYPNWSGTSSIVKYPALSMGTFSTKEEIIKFENSTPWTADFDWSLILKGDYLNIASLDDSLIFTKSYGNGHIDVYKLKKQ